MKSLTNNSRNLLYGQALSYMGDYCVLPALLILSTYYEYYWVTSGVIIVRSIPMIFQPFLGILVDKFDRVKIMYWTDLVRGIIFLGLTFLPKGQYPILFLSFLLISYGSGVFFNPARLAVMSTLGNEIKKINTLFAKATTLAIIIGSLIGALFLYYGSVNLAVGFNAITYFISAFFIKQMKIETTSFVPGNIKDGLNSFKQGIHIIKHNPFVLNAIFTMMTMALLWGIVYSYFPIASSYIGNGEIGNFILTLCIGLGGFIGVQFVNKWGFNDNKGLNYFSIISLISLGFFLTSTHFSVSFLAAIGFFIAMEYGEVIAKVKVQENAENAVQGRIFAVSEALIGLFISIGSTLINFANSSVILGVIVLIIFGLYIHTKIVNKLYQKNQLSTNRMGL
ncbi:MFS transporter [Bacillus cereus group sp. N21]|uniref:MFS transporter n=1 Tax=Bacillus cereus group sp. N21 TaxID=2794591 RepID=UPI0018F795FD|nr:MFS transporter [Bacillus cereus group sp. N21]MBJ8031287.1 MFS transporter [Bacillus cereus group sp. N21]